MKTKIYYFSGTGNSFWVARELAGALENAELVSIVRVLEEAETQKRGIDTAAEKIGIVFPVYAWGVPRIVVSFIKKLSGEGIKYCFAVTTCGGNQAATLLQAESLLKEREIELQAGYVIKLPSNYIITNGAVTLEKQEKMFTTARSRLDKIIPVIKNNQKSGVERDFFIVNIFGKLVYSLFMSNPDKARYFTSDVRCTGCGVCTKVCPTGNITIEKNKPVWERNCEQCLACIQWCPAKAIQYKHATQYRNRYHHPEVKVEDISHRKDIRTPENMNTSEYMSTSEHMSTPENRKKFRTLKIKRTPK